MNLAEALLYQREQEEAKRPFYGNPNLAAQGRNANIAERSQAFPFMQAADAQFQKEKSSLSDRGAVTDLINKGFIAGLGGAPVDLINMGLTPLGMGSAFPFGGSEHIKRAMEDYGVATPTDRPIMEGIASLTPPRAVMGAARVAGQGAEAVGRAATEIANAEMAGRAGLSGQSGAITLAKTGSVPKSIENQKINNSASEWRNSNLLTFTNPNARSALVRDNLYMTIKELSGGKLLLEHSPMWGSTEKPFYMVGNDVGELVSSAILRLERSNKSVDASKKSKFDNSLIGKLTAEYGDTFSTAKSGRSESNYITHTPSGTKIRISEHNLPLGYVQPDVDLRIGQSLDEQLAEIRKVLGQ